MRSMLRSLATGSALLGLAALGCGEQGAGTAADPIERKPAPEGPFKPAGIEDTIDVLASEMERADAAELRLGVALGSGERWDPVKAGAERAFAELGVQGVVTASSEAEQVEFLKRERDGGSNGIGVAPLASSLADEAERARADGIPVVTIGNDLLTERELFVGLGQYEIGQRLGDFVVQATGLREGSVIILGADDEAISSAAYQRSLGAKNVMTDTGLEVVIRNTSSEAQDVETLKNDLLGSPRPLAMLGVLETSYRVALAAEAAERSLAADAGEEEPAGLVRLRNVPFVAYGLEQATIDALRGEILRATFAERRHYMGYVVPYVLAGFNLLGVERTKYILTPHVLEDGTLDVGLDLIRPKDLDAYFEFQELLPH